MARGQLRGFVATPKTATASKAEQKDFVDNIEKAAIVQHTAYGKVQNAQEAKRVQDELRKLPESAYVTEKILNYDIRKLELDASIRDLQADNDLFDSNLKTSLKGIAQEGHTDIQGKLIPGYAQQYTEAAGAYKDLLDKRLSYPGNSGEITAAQTAYLKELEDKAHFYNGLANGYVWPDENGELGGHLVEGEYAVLVDTNPGTGKINNIDIVPSSSVPKDYMPSDTRANVSPTQKAKGLPLYLRAFKSLGEDGKPVFTSRLGDKTFQADAKTNEAEGTVAGVLKFKAEAVSGRNLWQKITRQGSAGDVAEATKQSGISLSGFDAYDIPDGSLVKIGSRTFLQAKANELYEIGGKTTDEKNANLQRLLTFNGLSMPDVKTYHATRDYVYGADGNSRVKDVVDESYFKVGNGQAPGAVNTTVFTPPPSQTPMAPQSQATTSPGFFAAKNRTVGLDTPAASRGNQTSTPDVVEGGKSFFRKAVDFVRGR